MQFKVIAANDAEYRLKATFRVKGRTPFNMYVVVDERYGIRLKFREDLENLEADAITTMLKREWKQILPRVESKCRLELRMCGEGTYKLGFEEAFSSKDAIVFYFQPSKYKGTLTLAQLKRELKLSGIPLLSMDEDKRYYRYGGAEKYYKIFVHKKYKSKLDQYIKSASDRGFVSYKSPYM